MSATENTAAGRRRDPEVDRRIAQAAIVRRGIDRGEVAGSASVTLLLDTLVGGAMMHALNTPPGQRADLARDTSGYALRLVDFLLDAVTVQTTHEAR
ncbi:MAG: TetR/AcrR family transcriptional regulator C-terminal ligand-binding domain-containing protein [Actinoplanes sp.]